MPTSLIVFADSLVVLSRQTYDILTCDVTVQISDELVNLTASGLPVVSKQHPINKPRDSMKLS